MIRSAPRGSIARCAANRHGVRIEHTQDCSGVRVDRYSSELCILNRAVVVAHGDKDVGGLLWNLQISHRRIGRQYFIRCFNRLIEREQWGSGSERERLWQRYVGKGLANAPASSDDDCSGDRDGEGKVDAGKADSQQGGTTPKTYNRVKIPIDPVPARSSP
jgi:hypothetical protein